MPLDMATTKPPAAGVDGSRWRRLTTALLRPVPPCALAGSLLGLVDVLDTMVEGWASALTASETLVFLAAGPIVGFGVGALVGLAWGVVVVAAGRCGLVWTPAVGLTRGARTILSVHHLQSALVVFVTVWTVAALVLFSSILTVPLWLALAVVVAAGAALLAARAILRPAIVVPVTWLVLLAWFYFLETRVLYSFSRYGVANPVHAGSACVLMLLIMAAWFHRFGSSMSPRPDRGRRGSWLALVAGVLIVCTLRFPLDATSNDLRIALYERTTILYRAFLLMPHRIEDARSLRLAARCPPSVARAPASAPGGKPLQGVVVIMVDALRGDHAPSSHRPGLTPALARFASQGTHFPRAYTTLAATKYAVRSMMTGSGALPRDQSPPESAFLPAVLRKAGIRTINVADYQHLRHMMGRFDVFVPASDHIDVAHRKTNASHLSFARARHQLESLAPGQRFFMFVHFYDPHNDYVPNDLFDFGRSLHARYDAEVAYADHWVGRLLEHLEAQGLTDDVAVMILGDHGDEFWEHRYRWHRVRVYDETVRVPLLLRVPGGVRARTVATPVSISDVAPTVLELLGLDPSSTVGGVSLLPAARGVPQPVDRVVFSASSQYRTYAAVSGDHKLILNQETNIVEYYDLARDPGERNNLSDEVKVEATPLYCRLVDWIAAHE